jgi:hypothetical protein
MKETEIPVFLFTGFLDSGKTTFIQGTLEDERFNDGTPILVILCEDGEEELDFSAYPHDCVTKVTFDDEQFLTPDRLEAARRRAQADRVIVEYNGMWMIDNIFRALPEGWFVAQEITFADASTYPSYNANMRNLVYDKLKTCDVVNFNRMTDSIDKMELHKIVRSVGRRTDILYDYGNDRVEPDDIEDPLPFDIDAKIVEIEDKDFALWYSDMMEKLEKYDGKTVRFKGYLGHDPSLPKGAFVAGRHVMACCAEDVQYAGILCKWNKASSVPNASWGMVEAKVKIEKNKVYSGAGPVLYVESVTPCSEPEQVVVTFS